MTCSLLSVPTLPVTTTLFPTKRAGGVRSINTQASSPACSEYTGFLVTGHWRAQFGPTQRLS